MTDREQLASYHTAAIRRHWRTLTDSGGQPPQALLDELAAIAEYHAGGRTAGALKALSEEPAGREPAAPPAAGPAPRRTGRSESSSKPPRPRRATEP